LCVGIAGYWLTVDGDDASALLGDDPSGEASRALDELCEARCDRQVLLYILKVMRDRLPSYWWNGDEPKEDATRRRDDADIADLFAAIIKERYAFFLPRENMTADDEQNLRAWDQLSILQGGVSPSRLLLGVESVADQLRLPDELRRAAALRSNQDDFDVISRYVLCDYVQRTTGEWHDREVAVLLTQIGNYKGDRRNATLDAQSLRQWRAHNQERLEPLSSWAVDQLISLAQSNVESPSSK
jgi:hypothetical protein